ncbi:CpsD/CapB family tyrosine-protein kinase [Litorilinea aerophila]|nr:CpsD/CapB family tyrosine-protein kinase [Litorilinea aerophila]MCC9077070.1 CpsD/CapB family tyrosine-protein kinase [Litorilinea aerophila]GIV76186.1 MAG: tyrosine protein kinase [Litorilinea sp.]
MLNLITLTEPRSPASEAYLSLRTNIEFSSLGRPLRTLLGASVDSTTDKSRALANLAVVMAQAGDQVILVDGDLRRPQQHEIFGLHSQGGLASWLTEGGSIPLQKTPVEGLQLLTAGPVPANPVALLNRARLEELLEELSRQADYVLVDAPPVLAVTDAALWASKVDGVILLVSAGSTRREQAQRAKAVLEKVHAHLLGAVLLNADKDATLSGYGA